MIFQLVYSHERRFRSRNISNISKRRKCDSERERLSALRTWQGLRRRRIGSRRTMSSMLMHSCTFRAGGDANILRYDTSVDISLNHVTGITSTSLSKRATGKERERWRERERGERVDRGVRESEREVRGTDFPGAPT